MFEIITMATIIVAAGFLQGLTGFGLILIALPLLGFFIDIKTVIPLLVLLALCISLALSLQLRKSINLQSVYGLMGATLPGVLLGSFILTKVSTTTLSIILGVTMILFTSYQLCIKPKTVSLGLPFALAAGFTSGILAGSIGAGAPPVIVYTAMQPWDKDQAKGTLAFCFALTGATVAATHAYAGMITPTVLNMFLISLPAMALGLFLGTTAYKRLSDHGYKKIALILVFILGCTIIYKNI